MDNIAGTKSGLTWAVHIAVVLLVLLWIFPTVGLLVSSFRTADQISTSGWWASLFPAEQTLQVRTGGPEAAVQQDGVWVIEGNFIEDEGGLPAGSTIRSFGTSSRAVDACAPGEVAEPGDGETFVLNQDGTYRFTSVEEPGGRDQRIFVTAETGPAGETPAGATMLQGLVPAAIQ